MKPVLVGIGEILWDLLPAGRQLGGAPANFACHAQALGGEAYPVSCIGADPLGDEIRTRLGRLGLGTQYLAADPAHSTGTVTVELSADGKPTFTIMTGVAWDHVPQSPALLDLARRTDAVCFGSLAQRAPVTRDTIAAFLQATPPRALRVFDINLRQQFYSRAIIDASLRLANVLKINDEELPVVAELLGLAATDEAGRLAELAKRYPLRAVALTCGSRGSLLLAGGQLSRHPGITVKVVDSVGAGDAFTAAFVLGLLRGHDLESINVHANRVAAYVCTQAGATPPLPADLCQPAA